MYMHDIMDCIYVPSLTRELGVCVCVCVCMCVCVFSIEWHIDAVLACLVTIIL